MKFDIKLYRNGCSVMVTKEAPSNREAWQLALRDKEIKAFIESSPEYYDKSVISQEAKDRIKHTCHYGKPIKYRVSFDI